MRPRPRPRPERMRPRTRPRLKIFFETEATMYEAEVEVRHVREQLSVYEHEDEDIGVQNIVFSKLPIHHRNVCRWLYCEY